MRKLEDLPEIDIWKDEPTAILKSIPPFFINSKGEKQYHSYNTYFFIMMWAAFTKGRNKVTYDIFYEWAGYEYNKEWYMKWKQTWDYISKNYKPKKDNKHKPIRIRHIKQILEKCYGGWKNMRLERFKKNMITNEDCDLLLGEERAKKYNGNCYVEYTDYDKNKKINLNKSNMGAGKTKSFVDFTRENKVENVLVLSCRRTLAYDFYRACNVYRFKLYSEENDLESINRLILQLESITRLSKEKKFDLIVMDEIESLLQIFNVDATLRNGCKDSYSIKFRQAWKALKRIIESAKWVFGFDAIMTKRTLDFFKLQNYSRKDDMFLIGREDKYDKIDKKIDYYCDWKFMLKRICEMVAKKKRCIFSIQEKMVKKMIY